MCKLLLSCDFFGLPPVLPGGLSVVGLYYITFIFIINVIDYSRFYHEYILPKLVFVCLGESIHFCSLG